MTNKAQKMLKINTLFMVLVFLFLQLPVWDTIDAKANDIWIKEQAQQQLADDAIIIVDIDDKSLLDFEAEVGRWPWPRSVYAYLLEELMAYKPKAIVFDVMFSEKDLYRPDSDTYFNEIINTIPNSYFAASLLGAQSGIDKIHIKHLPDSILLEKLSDPNDAFAISIILPSVINKSDVKTGLINFSGDDDGVSRMYNVSTQTGSHYLKSLPALVAEEVYGIAPNKTSIRLNYKGKDQIPYKTVSFIDAYNLLLNNDPILSKELESVFRDKVVIIGSSASGLHDLRETPISALQPAVSILATALDNLKNNDYYRLASPNLQWVLTILCCLLISFWMFFKVDFNAFLRRTMLSAVVTSILLVWMSYLTSNQQYLLPFATPVIFTWITFVMVNLYRGFNEFLGRQRATRIFGRFMDPRVVSSLVENDDWQDSLKTRAGEITILFSDIRGFTSISETRNAEEVIDLLNRYFDSQVSVIFAKGGTLDKFIGDAIMAFWGAPLPDDNQAFNAVTAALEMSRNLDEFVATLPEDLRHFDIGIGVHTGPAVVGMLGSSKRYDYTAIGDTVNLASRIEGVTKGRARVLVSDASKLACGDSLRFKEAGEFEVKGRKEAVKLWEPLMESYQSD